MKKFIALFVLLSFATAVCYAHPYDHGLKHKTEFCKKQFGVDPFEVPAVLTVPAAPAVCYDLVVPIIKHSTRLVRPCSHSPPQNFNLSFSYSKLFRGKIQVK